MATLDYHNKLMLAPMVRCGTLPLRLLAVQYGADIVYGEELVDKKLMATKRSVQGDFVLFRLPGHQEPVYSTHPLEAGRNVCQIGTADSQLALQAASVVAGDVAAIDVNMGCPKSFSTQAGMGAALLRKVDLAADILKTLKRNLPVSVTCKVRLLEDTPKTIALLQALEAAGAEAIGVHMRETHERPRDPAHWDRLKPLVPAVKVPLIANGDFYSLEDAAKIREQTGVSSVLFARGALKNPSVFRQAGMLPMEDVVREYYRKCADCGCIFANAKYTSMQILRYNEALNTDIGIALTRAKSWEQMARVFRMRAECSGETVKLFDMTAADPLQAVMEPDADIAADLAEPSAKRQHCEADD